MAVHDNDHGCLINGVFGRNFLSLYLANIQTNGQKAHQKRPTNSQVPALATRDRQQYDFETKLEIVRRAVQSVGKAHAQKFA